jgi:hypothetical protein
MQRHRAIPRYVVIYGLRIGLPNENPIRFAPINHLKCLAASFEYRILPVAATWVSMRSDPHGAMHCPRIPP